MALVEAAQSAALGAATACPTLAFGQVSRALASVGHRRDTELVILARCEENLGVLEANQ